MEDFSVRIRGVAEIQRALFQLNARLGERVTRLALRKGANYMLKEIRAVVPFKTGRLKKAIKVKNSRINQIRKNGKTGVYLTIDPGKSRRDMRGAWYGKFVEVGYNTGSANVRGRRALLSSLTATGNRNAPRTINRDRRFRTATYRRRGGGTQVPGKHFVLNTFNATAPAALAIMVEASEVATRHLARELNLHVTGR